MVQSRARKKPIVVSDEDEDEDERSPPPKRPKRGTRRAASPKVASPSKKAAKPPGKTAIHKPITSFFATVPPRPQPPIPSLEKSTASTPLAKVDDEILDEILDSSDNEPPLVPTKRPTALPVRGAKSTVSTPTITDGPPRGSQKFARAAGAVRQIASTPAAAAAASVGATDRRPWNEKYGPSTLDELAVHKKKIADVRAWLTGVLDGRDRKRLLLLKGPAGSGKTTTMALLSAELGIHIHEWKNPTSSIPSSDGFISATAQFEDFIGRTGAFGSLAFEEPSQARSTPTEPGRQRQLILVEEFPNTFTRTSSVIQSFRSSVLSYLASATPSASAFFAGKASAEPVTPVVMIISETLLSTNTASADSFTAHRLLGPEILTHPGVTTIEFNPIAPTFMTKALDAIVLKEARKSGRKKTVGPQVIQRLTELGDIRSAVSSLEFLCLRGDETEGWNTKVNFTKKKGPTDTPMTKMEKESLEMVTQRESTLGIFHAVGRVVYNKRKPEDPANPAPQPDNCFPERRRPKAPEADVDTLINELGTDTDTFIAALHENYMLSTDAGDSEETLDCIDGCVAALSDADLLSPDRFGRSGRKFQGSGIDNLRQDEMSFQSSVRGLLYNLPNPVQRITPPPGVMGIKAKGAGSAQSKPGSAFAMYYPASLRLWRQQEEIGGLLEMWISRAQRGDILTSIPDTVKPISTGTGSVDTWRKTTSFAQPSKPPSAQSTAEVAPPPVLLGSGGSARYEMLLERLPYLPTILRKNKPMSPAVSSTVREIQKITRFTGNASSSTPGGDDGDDALDRGEEVGEQEQWTTDKPGYSSPNKKKRVKIEMPGSKGEGNGILSEDDIED
ncbi:Rad17-domain-containing protein [Massarina eburnea CBS 473.64]|uniref:Rad17-domain-containing protein n=1 Tax=Massarina eburnea CBS 473.64 TaxID=1395130 RepID=A0A6A6RHH5_9PLEO|nr:Rad17-domain-containing protein [Massarina eburnea CBS 473.64]